MTNIYKLESLLDHFIESDPDRAERWLESTLAKIELRKRLAHRKAITPLPNTAQQQDEDAQCRCEPSDWIPPDDYDGDGSVSAMATRAAQRREPRGWQWLDTSVFRKKLPETAEPEAWHALYTSPQPSKPWVGLTDEEIREVGHLNVEGKRMLPYSFARAIEAKLREKNA